MLRAWWVWVLVIACAPTSSVRSTSRPIEPRELPALHATRRAGLAEPALRVAVGRDVWVAGQPSPVTVIVRRDLTGSLATADGRARLRARVTLEIARADGVAVSSVCPPSQQFEPGWTDLPMSYLSVRRACLDWMAAGIYRLSAVLRAVDLSQREIISGPTLLRVLDAAPAIAAPAGWTALPASVLEDRTVDACVVSSKEWFQVAIEGGQVAIRRQAQAASTGRDALPPELECMRPLFQSSLYLGGGGAWLNAIRRTPMGWFVGTGAGEWNGGGLYWIDPTGRLGRRILPDASTRPDRDVTNVSGIEADGDHWTVFENESVFRLDSRADPPTFERRADLGGLPVARTRTESGAWLISVEGAVDKTAAPTSRIVEVSAAGEVSAVAAPGPIAFQVLSIRKQGDESIWLGAHAGVLHLVPLWAEPPRYWPAYLVPVGSAVAAAHTGAPCPEPSLPASWEGRRHLVELAIAQNRAKVRAAEAAWDAEVRRRRDLGCLPVKKL
jgi:hypothetical protein